MGSARACQGICLPPSLISASSRRASHRHVFSLWSQMGPQQCHSVSSANPELKWKSEGKPALAGSGDPITGVLVNQSWPTCAQLQGQRRGRDGPPKEKGDAAIQQGGKGCWRWKNNKHLGHSSVPPEPSTEDILPTTLIQGTLLAQFGTLRLREDLGVAHDHQTPESRDPIVYAIDSGPSGYD